MEAIMTIEKIAEGEKITIKVLTERFNELVDVLNAMPAPRDRGPKSEHAMTVEDARSIICGELKDASHKEAAEKLGLSYGQVYSARKGFTFKEVHQELRKAKGAKK